MRFISISANVSHLDITVPDAHVVMVTLITYPNGVTWCSVYYSGVSLRDTQPRFLERSSFSSPDGYIALDTLHVVLEFRSWWNFIYGSIRSQLLLKNHSYGGNRFRGCCRSRVVWCYSRVREYVSSYYFDFCLSATPFHSYTFSLFQNSEGFRRITALILVSH